MLYGLSGYDPLVLAAAVAVISVAVLVATFGPARRASRIEPLQALRYE
jgi:ABC-type antimicrobial peptide transport system permease subunit